MRKLLNMLNVIEFWRQFYLESFLFFIFLFLVKIRFKILSILGSSLLGTDAASALIMGDNIVAFMHSTTFFLVLVNLLDYY